HAVRPERDLAIAHTARERRALAHEASAQPLAARRRLDVEHAELGDSFALRMLHQEDRADDLALLLRDPTALASRIEALEEVGHDARREGFVFVVPTVFARVEDRLARHDEAHVAGLVIAENDRRRRAWRRPERTLDVAHRLDDRALRRIA